MVTKCVTAHTALQEDLDGVIGNDRPVNLGTM